MKRVVLLFILLMTSAAVMAQDEEIDLLAAIALVRDAYGTEGVLVEADFDRGNACWEIEFADGLEVCVSRATGEITELDFDADDAISTFPTITLEEAIRIALEQFPDSVVTDVDLEITDAGVLLWEVELDNDRYAVYVHGEDGDVLYQSGDDDDLILLTPEISMAEAIEIALSLYPDSVVTDIDLEQWDAETLVWDIELDDDSFEIYIDALTGNVILTDFNDDDNRNVDGDATIITMQEAIEIALRIFPNSLVTEAELYNDDGRLIWEIELDNGTREVEINAVTGAVLEFGYMDNDDDDDRSDDDNDRRDDDDDDDDSNDDDDWDDDSDDDDDWDDDSDDDDDDDWDDDDNDDDDDD